MPNVPPLTQYQTGFTHGLAGGLVTDNPNMVDTQDWSDWNAGFLNANNKIFQGFTQEIEPDPGV